MATNSLVSMAATPSPVQSQGAMDGRNNDGALGAAVRTKAQQKQVMRAVAVARIRAKSGMGQPSAMSPAGFGNPTGGRAAQAYANLAPALQVGGGA